MKERPIVFSSTMVRAILDGRKTQTRRAIKGAALEAIEFCTGRADDTPAVSADLGVFYYHPEIHYPSRTVTLNYAEWLFYNAEYPDEGSLPVGQGYGAVGDRLWVRETWNTSENVLPRIERPYIYAAEQENGLMKWAARWRPSIHMPRAASRINLEITGVRVERLQDISTTDAIAEGLIAWTDPPRVVGTYYGVSRADCWEDDPRKTYQRLWGDINGAESWALNPWVWVLEFKRVD